MKKHFPAAAVAVFCAVALAVASTNLPFLDEGTFGGSALNILHTGYSGNPSTPPWGLGLPLEQSTRYNYWVMPLYLYLLAAWYRLTPETLLSARVLSVIFGMVALALFYRLLRRLSATPLVAGLAVLLAAVDFNLIIDASQARMDSLSLALNLGAWVAYLELRDRSTDAAFFWPAMLAGLSFITHPNGIIAFAGIAMLAIALDRGRRTRGWMLFAAGAAIPMIAAASTIVRAPAVWYQQLRAHSQHRFDGFLRPFDSIYWEFMSRYYLPFGGRRLHGSQFAIAHWALLGVLFLYLVATAIVLARFRGRLAKFAGAFFLITVIYFTFFESGKLAFYNIHVIPWLCLFVAIIAVRWRTAGIAMVAAIVIVNLVWSAYYVRANQYGTSYQRVAAMLRENMGPHDLVLTHAFFGYELGFDRATEDYTLVDIVRRKPLFVVMDHWITVPAENKAYKYGADPIEAGMITEDEKVQSAALLLTRYKVVFRTPDFTVCRRNF